MKVYKGGTVKKPPPAIIDECYQKPGWTGKYDNAWGWAIIVAMAGVLAFGAYDTFFSPPSHIPDYEREPYVPNQP